MQYPFGKVRKMRNIFCFISVQKNIILFVCFQVMNFYTIIKNAPIIIMSKSDRITIFLFCFLFTLSSSSTFFQPNSPLMLANPNLKSQKVANDDTDFLIGQQYTGTYKKTLKSGKLFEYLDSESGNVDCIFFNDPFKASINSLNSFVIFLFDPVYHDRKAVRVLINLENMTSQGEWASNASDAQIGKFWKQRQFSSENISNLAYSIKVKNMDQKNPSGVSLTISMKGKDFSFSSTLNYDDERVSTIGYCLYVMAVVAGQIFCSFMILKQLDGPNPNFSNKFSLTTVAFCNIQDFYLTMMHIQYIMASQSNSYLFYIIPSFSYIVLFVVFDMKLLFLVWRSHYMREIENPQALRKKLTTFYIKFYVALFIYLTLAYFFTYDEWLILLQNLIFIPQIVHNVRIGNNPGFQPYYIFGYLGLRFLIPLYERSCPSNHFLLSPITWLVITLSILYVLQILTLTLQYKFGPRFFVPRMFQPDYYQYNFKLKPTEQNKDLECSICLINIFDDDDMRMNSSSLEVPMMPAKTVMKTPCNHFFHKECLTNWIDVKMECPTCRTNLPPL